jgi:hypothetical protein
MLVHPVKDSCATRIEFLRVATALDLQKFFPAHLPLFVAVARGTGEQQVSGRIALARFGMIDVSLSMPRGSTAISAFVMKMDA